MAYEDWSSFAQTWGTIYFVVIFLSAVIYALWPSNRRMFEHASRLPISVQEHGDDRPLV